MPRIIVTADDSEARVLHSERVTPEDFETDHFRAQLAERVAWAVEDAERDAVSAAAARPNDPADTSGAKRAPTRAA